MHKLKSIEVTGFRGQANPIKITLKPDANFIIGRNGTGKTTFINLLNAGLTVDLPALRETKFIAIDFKFKRNGARNTPHIRIHKSPNDFEPIITYSVRENSKEDFQDFEILTARSRAQNFSEHSKRAFLNASNIKRLKDRISVIFDTTWLSLQRSSEAVETDDVEIVLEENDTRSDVDRKLDHVINELVRYFSRLDKLVSDQTQEFQKRWFLSFLSSERSFKLMRPSEEHLKADKADLEAIFNKFNLQSSDYLEQINTHFQLINKSVEALNKDRKNFEVRDVIALNDFARLHSLVEQWQILQAAQKEIYSPRIILTDILSRMLFRKKALINRSNQLTFVTTDKNDNALTVPVPPRKLSSGEKQLIIFLSEAILQESKDYIFLADEPELSLHVQWQEELVPNLLKINPNAQVIFATHSPDIVNIYQDAVVNMEDLID